MNVTVFQLIVFLFHYVVIAEMEIQKIPPVKGDVLSCGTVEINMLLAWV